MTQRLEVCSRSLTKLHLPCASGTRSCSNIWLAATTSCSRLFATTSKHYIWAVVSYWLRPSVRRRLLTCEGIVLQGLLSEIWCKGWMSSFGIQHGAVLLASMLRAKSTLEVGSARFACTPCKFHSLI